MGCGCGVNVDVDEFSTTLAKEMRKARKHHKCSECGREIGPGETYEHYRGVDDGDIFTVKTCCDCLSIRNVFFTDFYFERIREDLWSHIEESGAQISEDCLAELTPSAMEYVCSLIEEVWENDWLNNPTVPAVRLEKLQKRMDRWKWPGWVHYRSKEMAALDSEVLWWVGA